MSFNINNDCGGKSCTSPITSEYQDKSKEAEKSKKKKQIITEKEGRYYCTYMVDEKGQKVLLNKIPIDQVEKQKKSQKSIEFDKTKSCDNNGEKDDPTAFEHKRQMHMEAAHRKNIREIMDIIKGK